jgi:NADPH-dependent curcumin reductase CurA
MSSPANRSWKLVARPSGAFKPTDFAWTEEPLPTVADGQVRIRQLYLSLDPTNRGWAGPTATYLPPVPLGGVMRGIGLGIVEESRHPGFRAGQYAQGHLGWQLYYQGDGSGLTPFDPMPGVPLDAYLAVFGHIGATAYFGLLEVGQAKAGETVVVSAAAGAVGSLVGQIGKIHGCRVVGLAGTDEKCAWLTRDLGFDAAINYKTGPLRPRLAAQCPNGIDVHFENVGGEILDTALSLINLRARIVLCGLIAQYNNELPPPGPRWFGNILLKRARVEGFIILDYARRFPEAFAALGRWLAEGRLRYRVDLVEGLEQAPVAINRLFEGANIGKLLVRVSEP